MRKQYTPEQLLKMAVKKIAVDPGADLDGDGRVSSADARLADIAASAPAEPKPPAYAYQPDEKTAAAREAVLSGLLENGGETGLNINADKLYNQYRELYEKNAQASAENAYGLASRNTGGYGSSYAASAAAAAYNSFMEGLTDRALDIERLNLEKHAAGREDQLDTLAALNERDKTDYARFADRLELAFNAAKLGDYGPMEEMDLSSAALRRGDVRDLADYAAGYGDDSFLKAMGLDLSSLSDARAYSQAAAAAQYGDYSYLNALGVDTAQLQYNALLKTAAQLAQYGDYSALEALGVDVSRLKENEQFERALALAEYGDYSLLGNFTDNAENLRQKVNVTIQKGAEEAYAYGGYEALWNYIRKQVGYGQLSESTARQVLSVITGG
jgi:hypothetical protein